VNAELGLRCSRNLVGKVTAKKEEAMGDRQLAMIESIGRSIEM